VSHPKAVLTPVGRLILVRRIAQGRPAAHVAGEMGVSRATAYKWWHRYVHEGDAGLLDRSSRPLRSPRRTPARVERQIEALRRRTKLGPARIAVRLQMPASTVHRVLVRRHLSRLSWMDRPTGRVIRRYEHEHPGDLVHVDVKKLGRIPPGGGWRIHGRGVRPQALRGLGFDYIHSAVDDHSRLAYSEICSDERGPTAAAFWTRAIAFFAAHGIVVQRVLTDNAWAYRRSNAFRNAVLENGAVQRFIRPHRPQSNGKVERFNRTLLEEWAYVRPYTSNQRRSEALTTWLHTYNHHRAHTSLGQLPPISRLNNVSGHYT
jgi:transposase InsO family protein